MITTVTIILKIIPILLILCCLYNFFKNKNLLKNVMQDHLTGLYNRKVMSKIEKQEKNKDTFFVIACDIDHFKSVNDTYGHDTGDIVLKTVANTLKNSCKSNLDFAVRYGGEEFFIFMKNKNIDQSFIIRRVEEIRKKIENLNILTEDLKLIKITASFGISSNFTISLKERVSEADKFLYEAKNNGRNRVEYNKGV